MKVRCAWCDADMGGSPAGADGGTSHGMCDDCLDLHFPEDEVFEEEPRVLLPPFRGPIGSRWER